MSSFLFGILCVVGGTVPLSALAASSAPANASQFVRPVNLGDLNSRLKTLPAATRQMIELYLEATRRDVLSVTDGCYPDLDYRYHYRNLGERAKGAAVLSSLDGFWPDELRQRCRKEAIAFVREVAAAHRAKPNLGYEWQSAYVVAESGIAGWFLWDQLDADLRDAIAEMVIFQADRFIDAAPKMGYRNDTQAETISWNTSILTLAVNMMPDHPHCHAWDQAAKRYLYNTLAAPQDASDDTLGDDGRPVRHWIVGATLYPDFTLENHNQFHMDYVLCAYRYHIQGAALYWLTGRPLPQAFHHHLRDLYNIMLHCMTADGFFAYVSDNDWKRYHPWAETCAVHAYMAILEHNPLAAVLEKRALDNATSMWRAFSPGFAYDNPYVCGKAWTSRIADTVLMHIACPDPMPEALSPEKIQKSLEGTFRLDTPELLTHFSHGGSYASSCKGRDGVWVPYIAPRDDAWLLLPSAKNYQARIKDQLVIQKPTTRWKRGPDWFWVVRSNESSGSSEAFVSMPDGSAVYIQHIAAADLPKGCEVENTISTEKPHRSTVAYFNDGQMDLQTGQEQKGPVTGTWLNLADRFGVAYFTRDDQARASIRVPKPASRDAIRISTPAQPGEDLNAWLVLWPDQKHDETESRTRETRSLLRGSAMVLQAKDEELIFTPVNDTAHHSAEKTSTDPITAFRGGHKLF